MSHAGFRRFRRHRGAVAGAVIALFFAAVARFISTRQWRLEDWNVAESRQPLLVTSHCFLMQNGLFRGEALSRYAFMVARKSRT